MTFDRPDLLWIGPLAGALLALAIRVQTRRLALLRRALGEAAALRLLPVASAGPALRLACLLLAALALGLAAAEPRLAEPGSPEPPAPLDLAVAVDLSLSMSATDVAPSRLARARDVVAALAEALPGARVALVVFADAPYVLLPLTDDRAVVRWFVDGVAAESVPDRLQGTSLSSALVSARRALDARAREGARRTILVVTDGGTHEGRDAVLAAADAAAAGGVTIWTAGVGTARGATLRTASGPLLDARGAPALATLDEELLRAVAARGGGAYRDVSDAGGLAALVSSLAPHAGRSAPEEPSSDPTRWLALIALPLVLWEGALDAGRGLPRRRRAHGSVGP